MSLKFSCLFIFCMLLAGCGFINQPSASIQSTTTPARNITWMINTAALTSLQTAGSEWSQQDNMRVFDNTHTYAIGTMPDGWQSVSTRSFSSYAALKAAFAANSISSSVRAIIYDNEAWQFTPVVEQQSFALYIKEAADLVHSHHMQLIATPATDLVSVLAPGVQKNKYKRFLSLNILKEAAQYADVVEIQAQGSEASAATYAQFVHAAAAQAKAAKPGVVFLAGLSTNPDGQKVTGQQLYAAFQATSNDVSGYWLNIPSNQGGYCPKCGMPQPQVAIDFLQKVYATK